MAEEVIPEEENTTRKSTRASRPDPDKTPQYKYRQFLSLVLVAGFLVIGTSGGSFSLLGDLMVAPCLGCLGLYPNVQLEFVFDTANDQPHPDFVLDQLENEGPVFIEFTQNDENCPACKRMRPYVKQLKDEFSDRILFIIININENEFAQYYQGDTDLDPIEDTKEKSYYAIYDLENIAGGLVATPTYAIITLGMDDDGTVKPMFAVGYGEYKEEDAKKTKDDLAIALDVSLGNYFENREWYEP
jgi:thiol-disulfide isomerase/thioredoxin